MSHGQCSCPDCGTILRVRDRSYVGRQVQCPECHIDLVIKLNDDREYVAEQPKAAAKAKSKLPKPLAIPGRRIWSGLQQRLAAFARSPLVMAWALAIGITAFAGIVLLRPSHYFRNPIRQGSQESVQQQPQPADEANATTEPAETIVTTTTVTETTEASAPETTPEVAVVTPESPTKAIVSDPPMATDAATAENVPAPKKAENAPQLVVAAPPKINVEEKLQQEFLGFSTSKPISRAHLIEQLEEMLGDGAKIRYDRVELGEKNLEKSINISLGKTTLQGILKALLDSAGWDSVVEETGLRLKPRQVAGPTSP